MKKTIISLSAAVLVFGSCIQDKAPDPTMGVTTDKSEYKVGETVTFRFDGDPDNIVFYSGEYGHNYADKNNYSRVGTLYFDFTSYVRNGTLARNIEVLVSTDFNGIYDLENIKAATWHTIDAAWSDGSDNFPSGEFNINELLEEKNGSVNPDDNIYIAFHYFDWQDDQRATQNQWIIRSADVSIVSPAGEKSQLADMATFDWTCVPENIDAATTRILFKDLENVVPSQSDDWTVSPAFSIGGIPADTGVPVKGIDTDVTEYTYTYTEPGIYTAVFETSSYWYTGGSSYVASIEVKVTE